MPTHQALDVVLPLYQPLILYAMRLNGILHGVAPVTGLDSHHGISAISGLSGMSFGQGLDSQRAAAFSSIVTLRSRTLIDKSRPAGNDQLSLTNPEKNFVSAIILL
jgi:hypothetical protein